MSSAGYDPIGAGMLILAGGTRGLPMDYDELARWTRVGYERAMRSRRGERRVVTPRLIVLLSPSRKLDLEYRRPSVLLVTHHARQSLREICPAGGALSVPVLAGAEWDELETVIACGVGASKELT